MGGPKHPKVGSQNALLQGRSLWKTLLEHTVNIILNNYICCIDCRIGLSTINYLVILDIHRCKITKDYRKRKATCLLLLIGNERWTRCSSPATLIFRSSHSFITLSSSALFCFSLVHYIISPTSITLSITSGMFFFVFKFYLLQKRCCFKHDFRNTKL